MERARLIDAYLGRVRERVVLADDLDETPIAR